MKPKRVLLVDDNQTFLKAAKHFLRTLPGLVLVGEATSGEQALELTAELHPDLVLMDIKMPGMSGFEATHLIKQQPGAPKVIVLTMNGGSEFGARAKEAGADGFLLKENLVVELPQLIASLFPAGLG